MRFSRETVLAVAKASKKKKAPEEEGPVGPVPDPGEEPHHEEVEQMTSGADPVAPQGDVDVVPEPGGQGDVPAPPEVGDGDGQIGFVEILQEFLSPESKRFGIMWSNVF